MEQLSKITWSSHDDHATTCHLCHLVRRPSCWQTWDLRVPTLFSFNLFLSYDMYLFSIPTWRLIVCAPVPCSHPCLLHPHVDSRPSYRCLPDYVPIAYLYLQPGGSIPYK